MTEPRTVTGPDGEEYTQRPMDLKAAQPSRRKRRGKRVTVYNKYRARVFASDCVLEPESEASILESDLELLKQYVIKVAA